jgi:putative oxidoreductase
MLKSQQPLISSILQSNFSGDSTTQIIWLVVRVAVGLLMIHNGFSKLADVQGFADHVIKLIGLPFPVFFTYCAAYTEIIASILLIFGFLTRFSAIALFFTMLVAIYFHLKGEGWKVAPLETASLYALTYLLFAVKGSGNYAIDALLSQKFSPSK